jgi:hypothetical protein
MMEESNHSIRRLWASYKLYHLVSAIDGGDSSDYATVCTNAYLEYLEDMIEQQKYDWDYTLAIENQIRILNGFIECYDRPVKRDPLVHKTRWSK